MNGSGTLASSDSSTTPPGSASRSSCGTWTRWSKRSQAKIAAGANELTAVTFQTSRLRELRANARRRAIAAAREKAELYFAAAGGVAVGRVLAIEDANPELLTGRHEGHVHREPVVVDDTGDLKATDPAAIAVGAAVTILFELRDTPDTPHLSGSANTTE